MSLKVPQIPKLYIWQLLSRFERTTCTYISLVTLDVLNVVRPFFFAPFSHASNFTSHSQALTLYLPLWMALFVSVLFPSLSLFLSLLQTLSPEATPPIVLMKEKLRRKEFNNPFWLILHVLKTKQLIYKPVGLLSSVK